MSVTDTWADWSTTPGSDSPAATATPEIDAELRNIKAQTKLNCVDMTNDQTIDGIKTLAHFPVGPSAAPTTNYQLANKKYVDDSVPTNTVLVTGDQTVAGVKTFSSFPVTPSSDPSTDYQVANKKYVDDTIPTTGMVRTAYMRYSDHKANNTSAGNSVADAWYDRDLNTEDADYGTLGSVGSNHVTLPAGTYYFRARAPFFASGGCKIRLYNITDSSVILTGSTAYCTSGATPSNTHAFVEGYFTIADTKALAVQYRVGYSSSDGLGLPANFSETEIYTVLELWKVA